jgi:hypothetical protein
MQGREPPLHRDELKEYLGSSYHRFGGDRIEERNPPRGGRAPYGIRVADWFLSCPRNHKNIAISTIAMFYFLNNLE